MVTRFRWPVIAAAGGRTATTIRWSRSAMSAAGCIGHGWRNGCRGRSRRGSASCSQRSAHTGTGPGGILGIDRGPGIGATGGDLRGRRPRPAAITVIRKGSRALQQLPASPDAFVWLRLYQAQMQDLVSFGRGQPLWRTLRSPFSPLTYHAAYRMFTRASATLGANWSLHDLRPLGGLPDGPRSADAAPDVQWVLGHARPHRPPSCICRPGPRRDRQRPGLPPAPGRGGNPRRARPGPGRVAEGAVRAGRDGRAESAGARLQRLAGSGALAAAAALARLYVQALGGRRRAVRRGRPGG